MLRLATAATALLLLSAAPALAEGPQSFKAGSVTVDGLLGTLDIAVDPAATEVTLDVAGPDRWVEEVTVVHYKNRLVVVQDQRPAQIGTAPRADWLNVRLTVPTGTEVMIENHVGDGTVGDLSIAQSGTTPVRIRNSSL